MITSFENIIEFQHANVLPTVGLITNAGDSRLSRNTYEADFLTPEMKVHSNSRDLGGDRHDSTVISTVITPLPRKGIMFYLSALFSVRPVVRPVMTSVCPARRASRAGRKPADWP